MLKRIFLIFTVILLITIVEGKAKNNNTIENPTFKIGVNRFAWYASLQTINFMPIISADPFSGVILSDWYAVNAEERYKIDVYILEELLTADTVDVRVFRQVMSGNAGLIVK